MHGDGVADGHSRLLFLPDTLLDSIDAAGGPSGLDDSQVGRLPLELNIAKLPSVSSTWQLFSSLGIRPTCSLIIPACRENLFPLAHLRRAGRASRRCVEHGQLLIGETFVVVVAVTRRLQTMLVHYRHRSIDVVVAFRVQATVLLAYTTHH